jgi:hypothetical protein
MVDNKNIDIKSFVMQWNKIHDKTMKLLKDTEAAETMYMLFSIEADAEGGISFIDMASIMNNDPQYIQTVKKIANRKPHLSVVKGEKETMLMLCLT